MDYKLKISELEKEITKNLMNGYIEDYKLSDSKMNFILVLHVTLIAVIIGMIPLYKGLFFYNIILAGIASVFLGLFLLSTLAFIFCFKNCIMESLCYNKYYSKKLIDDLNQNIQCEANEITLKEFENIQNKAFNIVQHIAVKKFKWVRYAYSLLPLSISFAITFLIMIQF